MPEADRDVVSFEPEDLIAVIHSKYMVVRDAVNDTRRRHCIIFTITICNYMYTRNITLYIYVYSIYLYNIYVYVHP